MQLKATKLYEQNSFLQLALFLLPLLTIYDRDKPLCINIVVWNFSTLSWAKSGVSGVITGNIRLNWENLYIC